MDKIYNHKDVEEKWYSFWEENGFFKPNDSTKHFSIILPPPNANGRLHIGHAMYVIEDIMVRYHRMLGESTLWLPGADHAGILTQVVYEKQLEKEGKRREDLGREEFYKQTYSFTQKNKNEMYDQLKAMGFSLDWSREKFTLDPKISETIYSTFKKLYDDGLIYRGTRMINWCPRCSTVLSDLEVIHKEKEGNIWYIKYPLKNSAAFITIATTRPETMLGDTAVAVNPDDKRYKDFVGKTATLPLIAREIPVISDTYVDPKFGTGAVKITPAHDPNDYEIGERHKLEQIQVIGFDDKMTDKSAQYSGLDKYVARKKIIEELESLGLLDKIERHVTNIGTCERCSTVVEPLISKQWFVAVNKPGTSGKNLAQDALSAVKSGKIKIIPSRFEKIYYNWMENLHDWCISRQLWWGHQIPVWYKGNEVFVGVDAPKDSGWQQDQDTLDTWFSSGQWPFTTLGYGQKDDLDFKKFYPTSVMETGYDILFFWVARMIMLGLYVTNEAPFKTVYLHGLVRDEKGQKMSKSKGNAIDPLIAADKYGADAVRMALVFGTGAGNDATIGEDKIKGMRNFTNKLWNIGRYIIEMKPDKVNYGSARNDVDEALLSELNQVKAKVTKAISDYRFSQAAEELYDFVWHSFADKYIEASKDRRGESQAVLEQVLEESLRLLHPFMPLITEEIWQKLPRKSGKSIMIAPWPSNTG